MEQVKSAASVAALPRQAVLGIRDLQTYFFTDNGIVKAVNGVNLTVGEGETLAIVGESGSGKSVTALTVMRLLARTPARVTGGSILFRDRGGGVLNLLALPEAEMQRIRGRLIAMIFQDPMSSLNPVFTVGDQIAEPLRIHKGLDRRAARKEAIDLLQQVGISDPDSRVDCYPHQLSGGMRQRVMIALALACDPRLLIADEPTTALDVTIQAQIIALLKQLQRERGMAMIFITHDLKLVSEVADRVAVMYASQVVEEGAVADVLSHPRHPYTKALMDCIPRRDYALPGRQSLRPIPGSLPDPLDPPAGCRFHARCGYAEARCTAHEPELEPVAPRHEVRCHRWKEIAW
jgi:oligopeptide/dipeptide ABC transporter ATP-binding protein